MAYAMTRAVAIPRRRPYTVPEGSDDANGVRNRTVSNPSLNTIMKAKATRPITVPFSTMSRVLFLISCSTCLPLMAIHTIIVVSTATAISAATPSKSLIDASDSPPKRIATPMPAAMLAPTARATPHQMYRVRSSLSVLIMYASTMLTINAASRTSRNVIRYCPSILFPLLSIRVAEPNSVDRIYIDIGMVFYLISDNEGRPLLGEPCRYPSSTVEQHGHCGNYHDERLDAASRRPAGGDTGIAHGDATGLS
jgi:hypothetical protein